MFFAVVADKLDLSSTQRRLEKEKYNFDVAINKLVYMTSTVLCVTRVSEGHF